MEKSSILFKKVDDRCQSEVNTDCNYKVRNDKYLKIIIFYACRTHTIQPFASLGAVFTSDINMCIQYL